MFGSKKPKKAGEPNALAKRLVRGDDSPTEPLADEATTNQANTIDDSEAKTRILGQGDEGQPAVDAPPVAVLMVISGPGQGSLLPVGIGMSPLGRGENQRITVNFGDEGISRSQHAIITYDALGDQFFLQPGGGPALTYLNGSPVLEPGALEDGGQLRVGDTTLLFRILVGPDFHWNSRGASGTAP